ncbi:MAG: acetyl-CoA carboxylase carboxyltransferase subunit alpha [Firmicutes bacterium]|jgi:acetyl-CoA carboxylase carboxyl transferase subunit alpha|nr:acetyl-CoA carboxylase carboxyltransferase subunit alpha [Bacillota bacterium]
MNKEIKVKIENLENKLNRFREFSNENDLDLSDEIKYIELELSLLREHEYENMNPWDRVNIARMKERPTALDYINEIFEGFIELHGDRLYGDDPAMVGGIAYFNGKPITVIGHQKGKDTKDNLKRNFGMANPEGYRKALRLMKQAEKFGRPVVTFVDTPGAYCGLGAEERGQGEAIARNLLEMSGLNVPIIVFVIGEGGSGGALGLSIGDRIYMLENSIYSVISPEGLSSILWGDASLVEKAANIMKLTAKNLKKLGIIEGVIKEAAGGAHKDISLVANQMKEILKSELNLLSSYESDELLDKRYEKYRSIGRTI